MAITLRAKHGSRKVIKTVVSNKAIIALFFLLYSCGAKQDPPLLIKTININSEKFSLVVRYFPQSDFRASFYRLDLVNKENMKLQHAFLYFEKCKNLSISYQKKIIKISADELQYETFRPLSRNGYKAKLTIGVGNMQTLSNIHYQNIIKKCPKYIKS